MTKKRIRLDDIEFKIIVQQYDEVTKQIKFMEETKKDMLKKFNLSPQLFCMRRKRLGL